MKKLRIYITVICLVLTQSIFASLNDTIVLTGRVTENRFPFPNAHIKLKGTDILIKADIDGNFILRIPPDIKLSKITLIVSGIGMITKEVTVKRIKRKIHVRLEPEMIIIE